jgi:hypothetical protein
MMFPVLRNNGILGQWSYNAHKVENVKVHYPWHPLFKKKEITVLQTIKRGGKNYYLVRLNQTSCILLPHWMTNKIYCQRFVLKQDANCSVSALLCLRRLLDNFDQ